MLRNKLKLKLKYEVNLRFETQIWKPDPDLKMKNLEMKSWIPGLNLEKNSLKPENGHFLVYFNKSSITEAFIWKVNLKSKGFHLKGFVILKHNIPFNTINTLLKDRTVVQNIMINSNPSLSVHKKGKLIRNIEIHFSLNFLFLKKRVSKLLQENTAFRSFWKSFQIHSFSVISLETVK